MKKILVTGGAGFIGSVLCRDLLKKGYQVRCVDNFEKLHCDPVIELVCNPLFEFMEGDVTDEEDVKRMMDGVDGVIHLASLVGAPVCQMKKRLANITNVEGTSNVIKYRPNNVPVIFSSTGSVFGRVQGLCTEDSPLNSNTVYGITKIKAENIVVSHDNTVTFRFATAYGVSPNTRVNLLINDLVMQAVTNKVISIYEPDANRVFISVKDMSRCLIWGLENCGNLKYKVYNAGDDNLNFTKRQIAEYISKKTGCDVNYNEVKEDPDNRNYKCSFKRLNDSGFFCQETDMEKGIDELIHAAKIIRIHHQYM